MQILTGWSGSANNINKLQIHIIMDKGKVFVGIYLLLALIVLCLIPVIAYFMKLENGIVRTLVYVGASGGIGGCVYSIRGFYHNLAGKTFEGNWVWWYVFRPLVSVVTGVFLYFLIVGGLMSISASPDVSYNKGVMFYCALAFLAGFSFTRFADKIEALSDTVFSKKDKTEEKK
jgi:hypothetical protein